MDRPEDAAKFLEKSNNQHLNAIRRLYKVLNAGDRQEAVKKVSFPIYMKKSRNKRLK